jgi:two-component system sensor histidine kinase QseC
MGAGMSLRWRALTQPSLTRRVMLALLLAVGLSFSVLVAMDWMALVWGDGSHRALPVETQALLQSLPADEASARAVVRSAEQRYQILRQQADMRLGKVRLRLKQMPVEPAGLTRLIYQSEDTPPPAPLSASTGSSGPADQPQVAETDDWVAQAHNDRWRLTLYEPIPPQLSMLQLLSADLLLPYLIALPLVMLPLGWAVWRGLRPLRGFVAQVRSHLPEDPRPWEMNLRYAELLPLNDAFETLLTKVRHSLQRERQLVQDAAHELRTPLAVMAAQAHVLCHAADQEERAQAATALERAIQRGSHLVHQLLTLAALDDAQAEPALAAVDLVALTRLYLISMAPLAQAQGIELALESPDEMPVQVDVTALHSILDNLMGNALRYIPSGSQVQVTLATTPTGWKLVVADDGPGIAPEDRARLMERFQRGRDVAASGSGLGLAIVRQAVQRMRGQMHIGPGLNGQGVSFQIEMGVETQK